MNAAVLCYVDFSTVQTTKTGRYDERVLVVDLVVVEAEQAQLELADGCLWVLQKEFCR